MRQSKEEYLMLREEILHLSEVENNIINVFYTSVTAILAFALLQDDNVFMILPYMVIIPSYLMFISKSQAIYKIGTYLYEFHECSEMFIWEHQNREFARKRDRVLLNDISYNLPFLIANIFTLLMFLYKVNWSGFLCAYELIKFLIALALFSYVIYLIQKKGKVDVEGYGEIWKEIKEENNIG